MITLILRLIISTAFVCGEGVGTILERSDIQYFKVNETLEDGLVHLEISGLAFHSSMAVKEVTTKVDGKTLCMLVHLVPARKGLSGNFKYNLSIKSDIDRVSFGNSKAIIWRRP